MLGAMRTPREVLQPRWRVFILKRKGERLPFIVGGQTPEAVIERAIKELDIAERERWRISVRREVVIPGL